MTLNYRLTFTFLLILGISLAQPNKLITNKDNYDWMFGASWMMLDDDGEATNVLNFSEYHTAPYPSRLFVDKYIYNGWSVEGSICFQKYDNLKRVNDAIGLTGSLIGLDVHSKYSFYKFLGKSWIDPYLIAGGGVSSRQLNDGNITKPFVVNANLGGGLNFLINLLLYPYILGL
jgi:hypothetical protein